MPFRSKSQQRFMFATMPNRAREWAHETKNIKKLPEKLTQTDPEETKKKKPPRDLPAQEKQAQLPRGPQGKSTNPGLPSARSTLAPTVIAAIEKAARAGSAQQQRPQPVAMGSQKAESRLAGTSILGGVLYPPSTKLAHEAVQKVLMDTRLRAEHVRRGALRGCVKVAQCGGRLETGAHDTVTAPAALDPGGPSNHVKRAVALPAQAATPPALPTPLAAAQQQMAQFLPGKPLMAGQGIRPTGLDAPNAQDAATAQPAPTPQGHATAVPGMEGSAAANPIDMHGPLDPRGLALDGNHAAGVQKGFKIAAWLREKQADGPVYRYRSGAERLSDAVNALNWDDIRSEVNYSAPADFVGPFRELTRRAREMHGQSRSLAQALQAAQQQRDTDLQLYQHTSASQSRDNARLRGQNADLASWVGNPRLWAGVGLGAGAMYGGKQLYDWWQSPAEDTQEKQANGTATGVAGAVARAAAMPAVGAGIGFAGNELGNLWSRLMGYKRLEDEKRVRNRWLSTGAGAGIGGAVGLSQLAGQLSKQGAAPTGTDGKPVKQPREDCAACGASLERSEEGYCNSCGLDFDTGKVPAKGRYHEGQKQAGHRTATANSPEKEVAGRAAVAALHRAIASFTQGLQGAAADQRFYTRDELMGKQAAHAGHGIFHYACGHTEQCRCRDAKDNEQRLKELCYDCQQEKQAAVQPLRALTDDPKWQKERRASCQGCESVHSRGGGVCELCGTSWRPKQATGGCESSHSDQSDPTSLWRASQLSQRVKAANWPSILTGRKEEKDKRRAGILPWAATGVGAGALGAAYGMGSDQQINRLVGAAKAYDPRAFTDPANHLPPNQTGLTYYQNTLSPAAQLSPFGTPVGDHLLAIRGSKRLMGQEPIFDVEQATNQGGLKGMLAGAIGSDSSLGKFLQKGLNTPSYALLDPAAREGVSGRAHYDSFAKGPVPAYIHQMKAKFPHTPVPAEFGVPDGTQYSDWMGRKLEDFLAQETGQRINPYEITTSFMPHEDQVKLMERFHASLPPEVQKWRIDVENPGEGYSTQTSNYLPRAEALANARNRLKDIGFTAGGAGVGGLTGSSLYRALTEDDEENWLGHTAATGAGMGLGGAAGYFGGTDAGRQQITDFIKRLTNR